MGKKWESLLRIFSPDGTRMIYGVLRDMVLNLPDYY